MCAARDEVAELKNLHLSEPMDFYFTCQGDDPEIDGVSISCNMSSLSFFLLRPSLSCAVDLY